MEWMRGAFNKIVKKEQNDSTSYSIEIENKMYANVKFQPLPTKLLGKQSNSNEEKCCVIYFNGTFSPCHIGHLNTMQVAGKYLREQGVRGKRERERDIRDMGLFIIFDLI